MQRWMWPVPRPHHTPPWHAVTVDAMPFQTSGMLQRAELQARLSIRGKQNGAQT